MPAFEIRTAGLPDIPAIRRIWEICFTSDPEYLRLVFEQMFPFVIPIVASLKEENPAIERIVSSAFLIPIRFRQTTASFRRKTEPGTNGSLLPEEGFEPRRIPGYYLYGVGTLPEERGRGIAAGMTRFAAEYAAKNGAGFLITRPAEPSLFTYYRRRGFTLPIRRRLIPVSDSPEQTPVPLHADTPVAPGKIGNKTAPLATTMWHTLRNRSFPDLFEWSPELLPVIRQTILLSGGSVEEIRRPDDSLRTAGTGNSSETSAKDSTGTSIGFSVGSSTETSTGDSGKNSIGTPGQKQFSGDIYLVSEYFESENGPYYVLETNLSPKQLRELISGSTETPVPRFAAYPVSPATNRIPSENGFRDEEYALVFPLGGTNPETFRYGFFNYAME